MEKKEALGEAYHGIWGIDTQHTHYPPIVLTLAELIQCAGEDVYQTHPTAVMWRAAVA